MCNYLLMICVFTDKWTNMTSVIFWQIQLKGRGKNGTKSEGGGSSRASKMFNRDCQLMGLTWLLARNKTAYIPTVSAVLRAIMYSTHPPHQSKCSPDQENMPLAVDSLQFGRSHSSASSLLSVHFSRSISSLLFIHVIAINLVFLLPWLTKL